MSRFDLVLNGRFFQRPVTGVERLALELSHAVRALMGDAALFEVAAPRGTPVDAARLTPAGLEPPMVHAVGRRDGHGWEQAELAGYRPEAWLLNLCNTAPMLRRRQAVVICDAQFILHPESYSRAFRWWYRVLLSVVSRRAQAVFTISEFSRGQLERYGVFPRGKAHVLQLGVDHLLRVVPDPTILDAQGLRARPYILATGSLARHKNLSMLIDAFVAAGLPDIDLVIAGGGNARVFGSAGFASGDNVRFLDRVSDGELRALYAHAMAFACPSLSEGFGFTPLEAMTVGCPVIATTGGAVPEACGDAALYADPQDPQQWRAALVRIASDAALRAELGARGQARSQRYRWAEAARQMLLVLAEQDGDGELAERLRTCATGQA